MFSPATRPGAGRSLLILLLILGSVPCAAGELLEAHVRQHKGHYLLSLDMRIHARAARVYAALLDIPNLPKINDTIKSAQILEHSKTARRVKLVIEGCVWIFCRRLHEVDSLTEPGEGYILSATDPAYSDFRYGRVLWQVIDEGKTTRVTYNADYVPKFWVPPLIGPVLLKHSMLKEGKKTLDGLEKFLQVETQQ